MILRKVFIRISDLIYKYAVGGWVSVATPEYSGGCGAIQPKRPKMN